MPQFRKKPVVIEAVRWTGSNPAEVSDFMGTSPAFPVLLAPAGPPIPYVEIETLEGTMRASPGDWIIRGVKGELYPCRGDIFAATYDLV